MSLLVQKFGGSSLADAEKLLHAAHIAKRAYEAGYDVIVVVSAQGKTTDALLARAHELTQFPPARELDALLATGEQASAALFATALESLGVPAVSLCAWQLPIHTDGRHGDAQICAVGCERVRAELDRRRVVVAAGFQGLDAGRDITTLGRGGSDTTAVALAAAFGAALCRIYTDVDGVYTADPSLCPDARRLPEIGYAQMQLLAENGAKVLHDRSAALAALHRVPLEVRSCADGSVGTRIGDAAPLPLAGVTLRESASGALARVSIVGSSLPSLRLLREVAAELERSGVPVCGAEEGAQCASVFTAPEHGRAALRIVHALLFA